MSLRKVTQMAHTYTVTLTEERRVAYVKALHFFADDHEMNDRLNEAEFYRGLAHELERPRLTPDVFRSKKDK
jgi:hypothetical protein